MAVQGPDWNPARLEQGRPETVADAGTGVRARAEAARDLRKVNGAPRT